LLPFFRSHAQAKLAAFPEAGEHEAGPCLMIHLRRLLPEVSPHFSVSSSRAKRRESGGTMGHLEAAELIRQLLHPGECGVRDFAFYHARTSFGFAAGRQVLVLRASGKRGNKIPENLLPRIFVSGN
jgi:hypothetical protein